VLLGCTQNALGQLLTSAAQYDEALPLFQHSLATRVKVSGPDDATVAESLTNLAELFRLQGKYEDALQVRRGHAQLVGEGDRE